MDYATLLPLSQDEYNTFTNTNFITNNTYLGKESQELLSYQLVMPIVSTVLILLNLPVVISTAVILKRGTEPRATYLFLGNVALADLLMGGALLYGRFYPRPKHGLSVCFIQMGCVVSSTIISAYSIGLIAIDRFLYILHGFKYQHLMSPGKTHVMLLFTWLLGFIIGFMPLMGWYRKDNDGRLCWFIYILPTEHILFTLTVGILPIVLVTILYSIILYHAIKKVLQLQKASTSEGDNTNGLRAFQGGRKATDAGPENAQRQNSRPSKWKAVTVVALTTGCFICTWMPYQIACFWYILCDPHTHTATCKNLTFAIASPLQILGALNSFVNPLIYAWWHNGFRQNVKKICGGRMKRLVTITLTAPNSSTQNGKGS